jgi:hypothetical protein
MHSKKGEIAISDWSKLTKIYAMFTPWNLAEIKLACDGLSAVYKKHCHISLFLAWMIPIMV